MECNSLLDDHTIDASSLYASLFDLFDGIKVLGAVKPTEQLGCFLVCRSSCFLGLRKRRVGVKMQCIMGLTTAQRSNDRQDNNRGE